MSVKGREAAVRTRAKAYQCVVCRGFFHPRPARSKKLCASCYRKALKFHMGYCLHPAHKGERLVPRTRFPGLRWDGQCMACVAPSQVVEEDPWEGVVETRHDLAIKFLLGR
jgi:hypothetical protein